MSGGEIFAVSILAVLTGDGWFCGFMEIRTMRRIRRLGELHAHDLARDTRKRIT